MKHDQLIDIKMGNIFRKYFGKFGGMNHKSTHFFNLPIYRNSSINQKLIMINL